MRYFEKMSRDGVTVTAENGVLSAGSVRCAELLLKRGR
jgi:hypothetical protein